MTQRTKNDLDIKSKSSSDHRHGIKSVPLYLVMSGIGVAVLVLALIWAASYGWYHINVSIKLAISVIMLLLSQAAVGTILFQDRQGTLLSEGIGIVHCAITFITVALVQQAFYTGWNVPMYLWNCSILILPAIYLLRSIGVLTWYYVASLAWSSMAGAVNVPGGIAVIWLMLLLTVPFYGVLVRQNDEFRLSVFSWIATISVFGAFGFTVRTAGYVPFHMLSTLAVVILFTGYSIDIRKAWGVPFRWFGRLAAAGALLYSCMGSSWIKIVQGNDTHWLSVIITGLLFASMAIIYVKWLKKKLWTPTLYALIPILLALESLFVHNGAQPLTAILLSVIYIIFMASFEIGQGLRNGNFRHSAWGIVIFFGLIASFLSDYQISPVVPVVAILLLALIFWKCRSYLQKRKTTLLQKGRRARQHVGRTVTAVRSGQAAAPVPEEKPAEPMPEWMQPQRREERFTPQAAPAPKPKAASTVVPKPAVTSHFVPPVFHEPAQMPTVQPESRPRTREAVRPAAPPKPAPQTSSPWSNMPERPKREKHFSHSPWSQEGDKK